MVILRKPRARKSGAGLIICGVQHTGSQDGNNGWALRQVTASSPLQAATLNTAYFDDHPLFDFPDWTDGAGNVFCEIPIAYWWRGNLPDTADGSTPRWTMLMSTEPGTVDIGGTSCEFTASPGAFKRSGAWMDKFYFGKYRGYNAGSNKVGSKSGQTHWGNVTWTNFRTYCENNGSGYHMISLQEWHEICARAAIEKATFQIVPEATRATQASCKYRGIEDFCYGPAAAVWAEFCYGIQTNASGHVQLLQEAGGNFSDMATTIGHNNFVHSLLSGGLFDHVFLAASVGAEATCMIPDTSYTVANSIGTIHLASNSNAWGAFNIGLGNATSTAAASVGTRLCKW